MTSYKAFFSLRSAQAASFIRFSIRALGLSLAIFAWSLGSAPIAPGADNPYAGEYTLHSLGGSKVLPYWTASIGGDKFVLKTNSPDMKCSTTAAMELAGSDVTFTTTATNCKGDAKGDVDQGTLTLFGSTLTFISKTHGKKWVFVRVMKDKPAAAASAKSSASAQKSAVPAKSVSKNPLVSDDPKEPSKTERITLTNPGSTAPMGEVYFSWMGLPAAVRYNFTLEGQEDGGEFIEVALEMYNSMCDNMLCGQTKNLKPGYYTARVDSFYKRIGSKVKIIVGAPEEKPDPKSKKSKSKAPPPPPAPPSDVTGPVGSIKEPTVSVFQWPSVPGAITYHLNVLKKGDAPENAVIHVGNHGLLCQAEPCSVTLPNPIQAGEYVWWVESEIIAYGKEKSFYVIDPTKPMPKRLAPPTAEEEPKKKSKSWRKGPFQ